MKSSCVVPVRLLKCFENEEKNTFYVPCVVAIEILRGAML